MASESKNEKVSFPFYGADLAALDTRVLALKKAGVPARRGTIVRAVVCLPSVAQIFAHGLLLAEAFRIKGGPREDENTSDTITIRVPAEQLAKLDQIIKELKGKGYPATRAFLVRAVFRALPEGKELVAFMQRFLKEFPNQPRGAPAAKARKERRGKS